MAGRDGAERGPTDHGKLLQRDEKFTIFFKWFEGNEAAIFAVAAVPLLPVRKLGLERSVPCGDAFAIDLANRGPDFRRHGQDRVIHRWLGLSLSFRGCEENEDRQFFGDVVKA